MEFKSYNDIENSYNEKFITKIREYGFDNPNIEWVATVKIDGSNFQCCLDCDNNFVVGTRTRFLGRGDTFQGYERAMHNVHVQQALFQMKSIINEKYRDIINNEQYGLRVYGELCGGMYRHPDVDRVVGAQKIQGRISYHPDNVWIVFDIQLFDKNDNIIHMFEHRVVDSLCKAVGLPVVPIIKYGTFDQLINLPNDFNDTTGHQLFGLPIIENNITEGIVIKPNVPIRFGNHERVITKSKNEVFKERTVKTPKTPKEVIPMNELELKYFNIMREFVTESRLMSVISKVGNVDTKGFGIILGMFVKDIFKDFDKEYGEEILKLENQLPIDQFNLAKARKELSKEASSFIRPIFLQLLNQ